MTNIVEFLTARLDEDEQLAELQAPWPWHIGDDPTEVFAEDDVEVATAFALSSNQQRNTAAFIVCHDPARVLAEVKAKRRVMARHCPDEWHTLMSQRGLGIFVCDGCNSYYQGSDPVTEDLNKCPELRDMASVYADHPDYDPAWIVS